MRGIGSQQSTVMARLKFAPSAGRRRRHRRRRRRRRHRRHRRRRHRRRRRCRRRCRCRCRLRCSHCHRPRRPRRPGCRRREVGVGDDVGDVAKEGRN